MKRHHFANKGPYSQNHGFSVSHTWMWALDFTEGWVLKMELWCWRRLLKAPWTARRSNLKGNQSWVFTGRTDAEAEALILWPSDAKKLFGRDPDAGKDWRQKKRAAGIEMVRWHQRLNGHEFEESPGDSGRQRRLMCYTVHGIAES